MRHDQLLRIVHLFFACISWYTFALVAFAIPASSQESALDDFQLRQSTDFPRNPTPDEQIAMLRKETLEQGLYRLRNINMFFSPGPNDPGRISFDSPMDGKLSDELEHFSIDVIMSNRRVLKLYEELGAMPKGIAGDLVKQYLTKTLAEYRDAYAVDQRINNPQCCTREEADRAFAQHGSITGIGFVSNTPDPNEVTLSGQRYAVLSMVWLAAALELQTVHLTVLAIAEEGRRQRDLIYADKIHHYLYKETVLSYFSIYNRTILGSALLRTDPVLMQQVQANAGFPMQFNVLRQTLFDAKSTVYDRKRPDFSRGVITVEYFSSLTDAMFDTLLSVSQARK